MIKKNILSTDIAICGGALSGLTAALVLQKLNLNILIIDPQTIGELVKKDKRTTAIAAGPRNLYLEEGVWKLVQDKSEPINKIHIKDGSSKAEIDFDFSEVQDSLDADLVSSMGYVIENEYLLKGISHIINKNNNNSSVKRIKASVVSIELNQSYAEIELNNGKIVLASLVIGADGKNSSIRKMSGIEEKRTDYGQYAFVCQMYHNKSHQNIALEKFLPGGPLAILPMVSKLGYRSAVIWSDNKNVSMSRYQSSLKNPDEIAYEIERNVFDWLGNVNKVVLSAIYPLELVRAKSLVSKRFILIGDAAHGIHPIAGQGFNLTIRSIKIFAKMCHRRSRVGLDIGSEKFLKEYENVRKVDIEALVKATHNLNQLFRTTNPPVKLLRRLGLLAVQKSNYTKRAFMKYAMGI